MKTIKQMADELGVNKDKVKYQVRKLPSEHLVKMGNITYLTDDGILKLKELILGKTIGNPSGKTDDYPVNNRVTLPEDKISGENELYNILRAELDSKNEQISALQAELSVERTHGREQADKLSDLAAQLAELTRNNQLLLGVEQSRTNPALRSEDETVVHNGAGKERKKGFFQRFRKNQNP